MQAHPAMRLALVGVPVLLALGCQVTEEPGAPEEPDVAAAIRPEAVEVDTSAPGELSPAPGVVTDPTDPPMPPGPLPHVPFSPPQALPPGECAPPVGDWSGKASTYHRGTSGQFT